MCEPVAPEEIRAWIDDDFVENSDWVPDDAAEFNFAVEMSNILVHVIRWQPAGPLLIGQQFGYGEDI
jgi:hypothetical protein